MNTQVGSVSSTILEGVQALQILSPRQVMFVLPARKECRQCKCSIPGRQHYPSAQE